MLPINTPICLKAYTGNNLQNEFMWRNGRCNNANTMAWEQMVLLQTDDGKIIIQSRWNNRNLSVQPSGLCVFANHNQGLWEKFDVETKDGQYYFISCHTGKVMQCNHEGFAWCENHNRLASEAWTIIYPENTTMMTSEQLRIGSLAATGALFLPLTGVVAGALVPVAMSTFGVVVAGVGTFHAPLVTGGCAAILQVTSGALVTVPSAAVGAIAGASVAALVDPKKFK